MRKTIECSLRPITEYPASISTKNSKKKMGRYHGSVFCDVPEFGTKKWVVAVKIDLDFDLVEESNMSEIEAANACVEYLNTPPPRKKYAKKKPKSKYGTLEHHSSKVIEKDGDKYISALLITSDRKNKFFWGKGKSV